MPNVQPTYNEAPAVAVAGQVATMEPVDIVSRLVQPAGGIGFGKVARRGTADGTITDSTGSGAFEGITVVSKEVRPDNPDTYAQHDTAGVLKTGPIWVVAGATVAAGDAAYFVAASGAYTNVSTSNVAIPGGVFDTSAASGKLVRLRIS